MQAHGNEGVVITPCLLEQKDAEELAVGPSQKTRKELVEYKAVPEDAEAAVKKAIEKAPVPKKETTGEAGWTMIEISTETAHVQSYVKTSIAPSLDASADIPAKGGKPSKDLEQMARKLRDYYTAAHPDD